MSTIDHAGGGAVSDELKSATWSVTRRVDKDDADARDSGNDKCKEGGGVNPALQPANDGFHSVSIVAARRGALLSAGPNRSCPETNVTGAAS